MSNNLMSNRNENAAERGFSLIELLVVIAVIAILAAIIYPVFASAREKGRQATVISSYSRVYAALGRYELDHGNQAPDVLYDYPPSTVTALQAANIKVSTPPGLYPAYSEHDASIFQDPNNKVSDKTATTQVFVNGLTADGTLIKSPAKVDMYTFDALDVSPMVTGDKSIDDTRMVPRYQKAWTSLKADPADPAPAGVTEAAYLQQMAIPGGTGNGYVTCTTYHVQGYSKVLVLFRSGTTKTVDATQFFGAPAETSDDIGAITGVSAATFWKYTPNGY